MNVTSDLSKFNTDQLSRAIRLMSLYRNNIFYKNDNELSNDISICVNIRSDCVFLTDKEYRVYMQHNNRLERFYVCGSCGLEGFESEIEEDIIEEVGSLDEKGFFCPSCKMEGSFH